MFSMKKSRSTVLQRQLLVALCVGILLFSGCGVTDSASNSYGDTDDVPQSSDNQQSDDAYTSQLGQKKAESLNAYIDQVLSYPETTDYAREILERAKSNGGISVSDYEQTWSRYRQCMLDKGYKEIILTKYPNGIYVEAGHYAGTNEQEQKYQQDMRLCNADVGPVAAIYEVQIGNPNLYSSQSEAIVDCMRRENLVPLDYSVKDYMQDKSVDHYEDASVDLTQVGVRGCEVANSWYTSYPGDTKEQLF